MEHRPSGTGCLWRQTTITWRGKYWKGIKEGGSDLEDDKGEKADGRNITTIDRPRVRWEEDVDLANWNSRTRIAKSENWEPRNEKLEWETLGNLPGVQWKENQARWNSQQKKNRFNYFWRQSESLEELNQKPIGKESRVQKEIRTYFDSLPKCHKI